MPLNSTLSFTRSCVYRVTTADNHRRGLVGSMIYAASHGMLVDRVASLRDANGAAAATHFTAH